MFSDLSQSFLSSIPAFAKARHSLGSQAEAGAFPPLVFYFHDEGYSFDIEARWLRCAGLLKPCGWTVMASGPTEFHLALLDVSDLDVGCRLPRSGLDWSERESHMVPELQHDYHGSRTACQDCSRR